MLKQTENGILIEAKVLPNAGKNEIITTDRFLKIKIASAPVDGKANEALIKFLSRELEISKSQIEIIKGESNRNKTIFIKTDDETKIKLIQNRLQIK